MALPGSHLYKKAIIEGRKLPKTYAGFSFHSYETLPLSNKFLTSAEILRFRDEAFIDYYTYLPFLDKIEKKYGKIARMNIEEMTKIRLSRKILE